MACDERAKAVIPLVQGKHLVQHIVVKAKRLLLVGWESRAEDSNYEIEKNYHIQQHENQQVYCSEIVNRSHRVSIRISRLEDSNVPGSNASLDKVCSCALEVNECWQCSEEKQRDRDEEQLDHEPEASKSAQINDHRLDDFEDRSKELEGSKHVDKFDPQSAN